MGYRRKVLNSDPVGVICLYEVKLACGHSFVYEAIANRVPKMVECPKCNKAKPKRNWLKKLLK